MEIITKEGKDLEVLLNEICSEYNVSKDDFDAGVTYLDLMKQNVENLRRGLL